MEYPKQFTFASSEVTVNLPALNAGLEHIILGKIKALFDSAPELDALLTSVGTDSGVTNIMIVRAIKSTFETMPDALLDIASDIIGKEVEYIKQHSHYADLFRMMYQIWLVEQSRIEDAVTLVMSDLGIEQENETLSSEDVSVIESEST